MNDNGSLLERCVVNTNDKENSFTGIHKIDKEQRYEIRFPLCFRLSNTESGLRRDILCLIHVLAKFLDEKDSSFYGNGYEFVSTKLPVQAYLYIIRNYFEKGYYVERQSVVEIAKRGKIDWRKTIKTERPIVNEEDVVFLNFAVKNKRICENELITIIHKYCVHESFEKFGWLFTTMIPPKPEYSVSIRQMRLEVEKKLQETYDDNDRKLFESMLQIICTLSDKQDISLVYGTNRFEYVWERMVDYTFGISAKARFFPNTHWELKNHAVVDNSKLEPDSIMMFQGNVYVLDAKYYKYGYTWNPKHLPGTTSISKQITYGEYIATLEEYQDSHVYNAFIMPYSGNEICCIGSATSDWKFKKNSYETIVGILIDITDLMKNSIRLDSGKIAELAMAIRVEVEEKE